MEFTTEQILEALKKDEKLLKGVLPSVIDTDLGKELVAKRANIISKENIDEEIRKTHTAYDDDMFSILGERTGTTEDGKKQKTYDKTKELFNELKQLREKKSELSKDEKVKALEDQIEQLKKDGGASSLQETLETMKSDFEKRESDYQKTISELNGNQEVFKKKMLIADALRQININPKTPKSLQEMVLANAENQLIQNSKFEDDKLLFTDKDGKKLLNKSYDPLTPLEALNQLDAIKDISLSSEEEKGGGANPTISGKVQTKTVEGKDTKTLTLNKASFKTQSEFIEQAEKALAESGLTIRDDDFTTLKNKAYEEYGVAELPAT